LARLAEIEEVISYRGEQEEIELENLEGIEMEFRRIRNQVETLQRGSTQGASETKAFRADADARLLEAIARLGSLEQSLGLSGTQVSRPVSAKVRDSRVPKPTTKGSPNEEPPTLQDTVEIVKPADEEVRLEENQEPVQAGPLVLAEQALTDGKPRIARAVLERAMRESEASSKEPEFLYRYAETWFAEGLYEQAGLRYQKVVDLASDSSWSAWAMVRQGECFQKLGNADGARFFWEDVIRQYPDSEASKLAETLLKG
jgi:TolA-binding protein